MRTRFVIAALLLARGTAGAWVGGESGEVAAVGSPRADRALDPARGLPGGWEGRVDRETGVLAEMWGRFEPAPGAVGDAAVAEVAARAFLAAHLGRLAPGALLADLVVHANHEERGLRTVWFQQTWRGAPVIGGTIAIYFKADRIFAASSHALPNVTVAVPARRGAVSTSRAAAWLGGRVVTRATGPRVVLPLVGKAGLEYHVADEVELEATDRAGRWDVYLDPDGAPLLRRSRLHFATSTLQYDVGVRYPLGARQAMPAPRANITAAGAPTTTAADGTFAWTGSASTTVTPGLVGTQIAITNAAGALATASLAAQPGVPVVWSAATDELADAQLSAFIHVGISKVRARALLPSLASWLDTPVGVFVNEGDACNAFSTGDDIHFFQKSAMCENTGRLADVVDHEFGHSVHYHANQAGNFSSSLAEGLADFFAATVVEDHALGRGFAFTAAPVRDIDPAGREPSWPADRFADPHITGLIVAGALWDLRKALVADLGAAAAGPVIDTVFAGVLSNALDIPGAYLAARTADDDDGDLGNGSPHGCAIEAAFGRHGLAGAEFKTTVVGTPIVTGTSFAVPVTVPSGTTCPPPQVTGMELAWHVGDAAPSTVAFASGASWTAALPAQPDNTVVRYRITATLDDGSVVAFPQNPADPEYTLFVGTPTEIWCERFDTQPPWVNGPNSDWQWGMPKTNVIGDPTAAYAGSFVFGNDVTNDSRYTGNTKSTTITPIIAIPGFDQVHLQFRRWLTVEDARFDQAIVAVNGNPVWMNASSAEGDLDHLDREWRFQDVDLTAYAGSTVELSWSLASDMNRELGGWNLDEVCLVGVGPHPACGDGTVDPDEACDDGNTTAGDGCSATCTDEGDGGCCSAGTNPAGPLLLGLGVLAAALRRRNRGGPDSRTTSP